MERPRGAVSESRLFSTGTPVGSSSGIGSGGLGQSRRGSRGHRDRWLDRLPGIRQWSSRTQADGWAGEPGGDHPDLSHSGHGRARLCRTRRRCRGSAWRRWPVPILAARRPRPAAGHVHQDYTKFLDPAGLRGARIGVARAKFFGYSDATDRPAEAALGRAPARRRRAGRPSRTFRTPASTTTPSWRSCSTSSRPI